MAKRGGIDISLEMALNRTIKWETRPTWANLPGQRQPLARHAAGIGTNGCIRMDLHWPALLDACAALCRMSPKHPLNDIISTLGCLEVFGLHLSACRSQTLTGCTSRWWGLQLFLEAFTTLCFWPRGVLCGHLARSLAICFASDQLRYRVAASSCCLCI